MPKKKDWITDIEVSFCCQNNECLNKITCIIESNHIHKIAQCGECGKEYEVWAGKQGVGDK